MCGFAPAASRQATTSTCPFSADRNNGVAPLFQVTSRLARARTSWWLGTRVKHNARKCIHERARPTPRTHTYGVCTWGRALLTQTRTPTKISTTACGGGARPSRNQTHLLHNSEMALLGCNQDRVGRVPLRSHKTAGSKIKHIQHCKTSNTVVVQLCLRTRPHTTVHTKNTTPSTTLGRVAPSADLDTGVAGDAQWRCLTSLPHLPLIRAATGAPTEHHTPERRQDRRHGRAKSPPRPRGCSGRLHTGPTPSRSDTVSDKEEGSRGGRVYGSLWVKANAAAAMQTTDEQGTQ